MKEPNDFLDPHDNFNFTKNEKGEDFDQQFLFKAFDYKFYEKGFNVSLGEEKITSSRILEVDIDKISQYLIPIAMMETYEEDGSLTRLASRY